MSRKVLFVDKYIKSGAIPIHLVRCKDTSGKDCYHFLMCSFEKIKALKKVIHGAFNLSDYGKVIASGYGHTPSELVRKKLKDEYNFNIDDVL